MESVNYESGTHRNLGIQCKEKLSLIICGDTCIR